MLRGTGHVVGAVLWRGAFFAALWWVLALGRADSWDVGAVTVALALAASLRLMPPARGRFSARGLAAFVGYFLAHSVKAGVQVAAMALRPRLDLAAGVVDVPIELPPGPARIVLAHTLTLLPGTLSVRLEGDWLRLHVLDLRLPVVEDVREVEAAIARIQGPAR
ncbi:MAG TPA: Na+/H+ antiporter subunit E [Patescibacteria group bacterium]|nr:Na+/H+ antiporter subunit E [Patescibacteria group bacterium]